MTKEGICYENNSTYRGRSRDQDQDGSLIRELRTAVHDLTKTPGQISLTLPVKPPC